jgi:hypothetical protein
MQRMRITIAVVVLVVVALVAGALAAHWPFWQRAWQWQTAADGWPDALPGPKVRISAAGSYLPLRVVTDARLSARVDDNTQMLLVGDTSGRVAAWFAPGTSELTPIDGRGLAAGLLGPLLGTLQVEPGALLLDVPLRSLLDRWQHDARGEITPRQLLWQLSGLENPPLVPLNPWSRRAQLASGPDFGRAALHTRQVFPPGTHFEVAPANAQLLALLAARVTGIAYADLVQRLWSQFAAQDAEGTLDHRRGQMAAHCCLRAAAADWLRLGLLLAADGRSGERQVLPAGHVAQMTVASPVHPGYGLGFRLGSSGAGNGTLLLETEGRSLGVAPRAGRAVLWAGKGAPPVWLYELLDPTLFALADSTASE